MLSPSEALAVVLQHVEPTRASELVPLRAAAGRVLVREIRSDLDIPPFPKSAMDGYAVRSAELAGAPPPGGWRLEVVGESVAGRPFRGAGGAGSAVLITTGAEVPAGYDAVVMVERTRSEGTSVCIEDTPRAGQNICVRGEDLREGALVFAAPRRLSATDVSVLASVGCEPVPVARRPRVAILTTGDELVGPACKPGPGQIRESNTLHLAALAERAGAEVLAVETVRDDAVVLERAFARALATCDVLLTTGGVSMGKYDLVAPAFRALGVRELFHKVAIKPGKPLWFGVSEQGGRRVLVFGLPGNPVSCLLDHEVFVRPALARLEGAPAEEQAERSRIGRWEGQAVAPLSRQQNLPVGVEQGADGLERLQPLRWSSSADIVGLARADGMAVVEAGERLEAGALVRYRPLR